MNFNIHDLVLLLPEDFLLGAICVILFVDLFLKSPQRVVTHWLSLIAVVATIGILLGDHDPQTTAFNGAYIHDGVAAVLKVFILGITGVVFVISRRYLVERGLFIGEFYLLTLFATLGMMLMVSAGNLVTAYLGLELFALSTYALVAMNRDSSQSSEAAMKYFVLGALASGLMLFGMSMIYGATGTLDLAKIHAVGSFAADNPHAHAAHVRRGVPRRRHRLRIRRGAVPHVAAGCVRGFADGGHRVRRIGAEDRRFRIRVSPARNRARAICRRTGSS